MGYQVSLSLVMLSSAVAPPVHRGEVPLCQSLQPTCCHEYPQKHPISKPEVLTLWTAVAFLALGTDGTRSVRRTEPQRC